jgi:hypothetical protein
MDKKQIRDDGAGRYIRDSVFVPKVERCPHQSDEMDRPDPREPVPDEISVPSQVQSTTDVAISIGQNESAQDEKEIDSKVTLIAEAEAEHVIVEQRHTRDPKTQVKESNKKGGNAAHGGKRNTPFARGSAGEAGNGKRSRC